MHIKDVRLHIPACRKFKGERSEAVRAWSTGRAAANVAPGAEVKLRVAFSHI